MNLSTTFCDNHFTTMTDLAAETSEPGRSRCPTAFYLPHRCCEICLFVSLLMNLFALVGREVK